MSARRRPRNRTILDAVVLSYAPLPTPLRTLRGQPQARDPRLPGGPGSRTDSAGPEDHAANRVLKSPRRAGTPHNPSTARKPSMYAFRAISG